MKNRIALLLALSWSAFTAQAAPDSALQNCTKIISSLDRLACFDAVAGTPVTPPSVPHPAELSPVLVPEIILQVQVNEAARKPEDSRFLLGKLVDIESDPALKEVVISAPALGAIQPRPYLAISCLSNITRLQFVLGSPIDSNVVQVRLLLDDKPLSAAGSWQVLSSGQLVDAGRGLPAIDLIKRLGNGKRLSVESNHDQLNGLVFDASGLNELIQVERAACRW